MKDVSELVVKQFRIFTPSSIPFAPAKSGIGRKKVADVFSFNDVSINAATGELVFEDGAIVTDQEIVAVIKNVMISPQRIVVEVEGGSEASNLVYETMKEKLGEFDPGGQWKSAKPIVFTEETKCVVTFDFEWDSLFSTQVVNFVKNPLLEFINNEGITASVRGAAMSIRLTFDSKDPRIKTHGINLSDKPLTIEVRGNTSLSERRFFTHSPVDSSTHLRLLEELESRILGSRS